MGRRARGLALQTNHAMPAQGKCNTRAPTSPHAEALRRFYTKVLGFREIARPDIGFPGLTACLPAPSHRPARLFASLPAARPPAWQPACSRSAAMLLAQCARTCAFLPACRPLAEGFGPHAPRHPKADPTVPRRFHNWKVGGHGCSSGVS
jgi:catechol 2,3-dioxygenase-like lactoylglutathione lyase family enzyme